MYSVKVEYVNGTEEIIDCENFNYSPNGKIYVANMSDGSKEMLSMHAITKVIVSQIPE